MAKRHSDSTGQSTPLYCSQLCFLVPKKQPKNVPPKQVRGDIFNPMPDTFTTGLFSNCDYNLDSNSCSIDKSMQEQLTTTVGIPGSSYKQMAMNSLYDAPGQNSYGLLFAQADEMNMHSHNPYANSIDQCSQLGHSYISDPPETRSSVSSCLLSRNQTPLEWNAGRTNYEMQDVVVYSWCSNANEQHALPNTIPNSWAV
uniref:Cadherin-related tumor suppressor n=4 Tax=Schistocephalus solidus TaxID=70667 RepID=A0A0X3NY69_SCHSO